LRRRAGRAYDRSFHPPGALRQLTAITVAPSRTRDLRRVRAPTLVIHGADDPLIRPRGGRATARAIPDARLRIIDGMGHDLPPALWPQLVTEIKDIADIADTTARAS
ncbi:MAG: alpha/beta fold hydrolase, partial [Myxococcota bacterium]